MGDFLFFVIALTLGAFAGHGLTNAYHNGQMGKCAQQHNVYECKIKYVLKEIK